MMSSYVYTDLTTFLHQVSLECIRWQRQGWNIQKFKICTWWLSRSLMLAHWGAAQQFISFLSFTYLQRRQLPNKIFKPNNLGIFSKLRPFVDHGTFFAPFCKEYYMFHILASTFWPESILHFMERENCRWRDLGQILKLVAAAQLVVWISSYVCLHIFLPRAQTLPTIAYHNKIHLPPESRLGDKTKWKGWQAGQTCLLIDQHLVASRPGMMNLWWPN